MRELNKREKNLGLMVLIVCGLSAWWFQGRGVETKLARIDAELRVMNERIRAAQGLLDAAQAGAPVAGQPQTAGPRPAEGKITVGLLKELTLPSETENVKILQVTRGDAGSFSMTIEGRFSEMMRFLSFLERNDSRFGVGNVDLGRVADDPTQPPARLIRGQMQLFSRGSG